ncbi:MobQ family relaxase [Ktedonobacter sp. SOSP1-52]|uniref:MobQ family relaxase n=1 Tax=Ktedonobacter sp. SOSP1-52 TaxID=2778366 RepID=UPI0019159045|nr:MobQ family relaxase [Ktedonobacter sp. SOSP1-52]
MIASWYHCSIKVMSRSTGRTAIAAAAYRSGEKLHDAQLDKTYDYTRRRGVETSFIVAPYGAPEWAYNLESLWNQAQVKDNRKNSCLARECELALPGSLDVTDREQLARDLALHLVERYGVVVSVALHEPSRHGDDRNYHAHIMFTTRSIDENGFGAKTRVLDERKTGSQEIRHIREYAANLINEYLEYAGKDERVDHRSFEDRGIMREPKKHLGVEASAMERRGQESRIGDDNREAKAHNAGIDLLVSELADLDAEISAEIEAEFFPLVEPEHELSWEEQKAAGQGFLKSNEDLSPPQPETTFAGPEQKKAAQSAFNNPIVKDFEEQIKNTGEIREYGLGIAIYDRTVAMFENLYYGTINYVKGGLQKIASRFNPRNPDIDIDPDR